MMVNLNPVSFSFDRLVQNFLFIYFLTGSDTDIIHRRHRQLDSPMWLHCLLYKGISAPFHITLGGLLSIVFYLWMYDIKYVWNFFPTNSINLLNLNVIGIFMNLELTFRFLLTCQWLYLQFHEEKELYDSVGANFSWLLSGWWVLLLWEKCQNSKT